MKNNNPRSLFAKLNDGGGFCVFDQTKLEQFNSIENEDGKSHYQLDDELKEVLANFTTYKEPTDKIFENDLIQADYGFKPFEL